jgi:hypothetical protein
MPLTFSIRREPVAHEFAGALVASEIELPELGKVVPADGTPVINIRYENATDSLRAIPQARECHVIDGDFRIDKDDASDLITIHFPGIADFYWCESTRVLFVRADDGVASHTIRHLLLDQVLPRVLAHTGRTVLHGSCVLTERGVAAFIGRSGQGKSTLSAALASHGSKLLSDDGFALTIGDCTVDARATYPSLRLLPDSVKELFGRCSTTTAVADYSRKRRVHAEFGAEAADAYPLSAIYLLGECGSLRVSKLGGREACAAILSNSFQLDANDTGRAARHLRSASRLLCLVPVFRLTYPRRYCELPRVCSILQEHMRILPARSEARAA